MSNKILRNGFIWLIEPSLFYSTLVLGNTILLRKKYQSEVLEIGEKAEQVDIKDKHSMQAIVNERNNLKASIRKEQNPLLRVLQEQENILLYGNRLGPNLEQLYGKKSIAHPDWDDTMIYKSIMESTGKSNAQVNQQVEYATYGAYILGVFLLLRLLISMSRSKRGEAMLSAIHILGIWLGGGLAFLTGFTFGVKWSNIDNVIYLSIGLGIVIGGIFTFAWDKIYLALFSKLQKDIKAVDELRP